MKSCEEIAEDIAIQKEEEWTYEIGRQRHTGINCSGLSKLIEQALLSERKVADELRDELNSISELLPHHEGRSVTQVSILDDVKDLVKENKELMANVEKLRAALKFCLGREVFGQGVCEADAQTEAYVKATKALAETESK